MPLFVGLACGILQTRAEEPNILFIFADDQAFDTIAAWEMMKSRHPISIAWSIAAQLLPTPYNMGSWSGAVCLASRHMLNTGLFVWDAEDEANRLGGGNNKKAPQADAGQNFSRKV